MTVFLFQFKPEFHAILMVDHATLLMERVHDRLHNGKTDSAAAVLSRACLIDFVRTWTRFCRYPPPESGLRY